MSALVTLVIHSQIKPDNYYVVMTELYVLMTEPFNFLTK